MMTLNEAIRKGCQSHPKQVYYVLHDPEKGNDNACILGAAIFGVADTLPSKATRDVNMLKTLFPELVEPAGCPFRCKTWAHCNDGEMRRTDIKILRDVLAHLNNDHKWSREAIAEWVEPHPELHLSTPTAEVVHADNRA